MSTRKKKNTSNKALTFKVMPYVRDTVKKLDRYFAKRPALTSFLQGMLVMAFILFIGMSMVLFNVQDRGHKEPVMFTVAPNTTATWISYDLQRQGLIPHILGFRIVAKAFGVEQKFHMGEYKLSSRMNLLKIVNTLQEKGALSINSGSSVTIPEGFTLKEIAELLEEKGICNERAFILSAYAVKRSPLAEKYPFIASMPIAFPEGYLFPDTYILPQNSSPNYILDIMLGRFDSVIEQFRPEIARNKLSLHQLITLASIIEKETGNPKERRMIAGVYLNRLQKVIHLGSCPTVKYALGQPHLPYLLYKHLNVRSPYNTYRNYGLPPGPIGSPGLASILAALRPEKTEYLYFVAKGDGTHVFTETLKEHLKVQEEMQAQHGGKIY